MTAEELDEKANGIIEAYKGFKILKDGSKKDKVFFILILLLFFIISGALFITNVFIDNFIAWVISLICWVCIVISAYAFQQYILKRETKVYIKGAKKEINFLNYFEEKIEAYGIKRDSYRLFIDYFTNELNLKKIYKKNEVVTYVTTIICPILTSFAIKNKEFKIKFRANWTWQDLKNGFTYESLKVKSNNINYDLIEQYDKEIDRISEIENPMGSKNIYYNNEIDNFYEVIHYSLKI